MDRARERQAAAAQANAESGTRTGGNMRMLVQDGDTTYLDRLPAVYVLARNRHTSERVAQIL